MLAGSTLKVIERERLEEMSETDEMCLEEAAMKAVGNATGYEVKSWVEKEGEDLKVVIEGDRMKNRGQKVLLRVRVGEGAKYVIVP
jgi:hypothetical protein